MTGKKVILLLFLLALLPSVIYSYSFFRGPALHDDGLEYHGLAVNLLEGKGFQWQGLKASRPPGYPFFLAAVYSVSGRSLKTVIFIQCILVALSCILIYLTAERILGRTTAVIAYFIAVFSFGMFSMPAEIVSEPLFTFLFCLSSFYLCGEKKNLSIFVSGIMAGLATLVRPVTTLLPVFILIFLIFRFGVLSGKAYIKFLIFSAAFAGVLFPWTLRNYGIYHKFIPVNIQSGATFWASNNPWIKGGDAVDLYCFPQKALEPYKSLSVPEKDRAYMREGIKYLKSLSPAGLTKLFLMKIFRLFYVFYPQYDISFGFIIPFFLYGLWLSLFRIKGETLAPVFLMAYLLFITLITYGSPRLRSPFLPYIAVISAAGLNGFYSGIYNNKRSKILLGIWVSINIAVVVYAGQLRQFILKIRDIL